eukprot:g1462.t1
MNMWLLRRDMPFEDSENDKSGNYLLTSSKTAITRLREGASCSFEEIVHITARHGALELQGLSSVSKCTVFRDSKAIEVSHKDACDPFVITPTDTKKYKILICLRPTGTTWPLIGGGKVPTAACLYVAYRSSETGKDSMECPRGDSSEESGKHAAGGGAAKKRACFSIFDFSSKRKKKGPGNDANGKSVYCRQTSKRCITVKLPTHWTSFGSSILQRRYENESDADHERPSPLKVAAFDFDNCLVHTNFHTEMKLPRDLLNNRVIPLLRTLHDRQGYRIAVLSNEATIGNRATEATIKRSIEVKTGRMDAFARALNRPILLLVATRKDRNRKPSSKDFSAGIGGIGMWEHLSAQWNAPEMLRKPAPGFFVGDAAGRGGDHSDADKRFAELVGLRFFTETQFFEKSLPSSIVPLDLQPGIGRTSLTAEATSKTDSGILRSGKQVILVLCGLPGVGKSHFAQSVVENTSSWSRINQDVLKTRKRCERACLDAIRRGQSVIVDRTNVTKEQRAHWIAIAKAEDVATVCVSLWASACAAKDIDTRKRLVGRCVERERHESDFCGAEKRRTIQRAVEGFSREYCLPTADEGFGELLCCNCDGEARSLATAISKHSPHADEGIVGGGTQAAGGLRGRLLGLWAYASTTRLFFAKRAKRHAVSLWHFRIEKRARPKDAHRFDRRRAFEKEVVHQDSNCVNVLFTDTRPSQEIKARCIILHELLDKKRRNINPFLKSMDMLLVQKIRGGILDICVEPVSNQVWPCCIPCDLLVDKLEFESFVETNQNSTKLGVLFTTAYFEPPFGSKGAEPPDMFGHMLYFNFSDPWSIVRSSVDPQVMDLKRALDAEIFNVRSRGRGEDARSGRAIAKYETSYEHYPTLPPMFANMNVVSSQGSLWIFLLPSFVFYTLLFAIVSERVAGLRLMLQLTGITQTQYFSSWWLPASAASLVMICVLQIVAGAMHFELFLRCDAMLMICFLTLVFASMVALALAVSVIANTTREAQGYGAVNLLYGLTICVVASVANGMPIKIIMSQDATAWVHILRTILSFHPALPFAFFWIQIRSATRSSNILDNDNNLTTVPDVRFDEWRKEIDMSAFIILRGGGRSGKCETRTIRALNEVSMNVAYGEIVGILGSNGAGKTTFIRSIIGSVGVTSGNIQIAGKNVTDKGVGPDRVQQIGVCPQFDVLWGALSPRQHIDFFAKLRGFRDTSKRNARVDELLRASDLEKNADIASSSLSGGNRRRLTLALAMTGTPTILLLDEPTSGCDPIARRGIWKTLERIRERDDVSKKCAIILTTHLMEEANRLAQKVFILNRGRVVAEGSPIHLKNTLGGGNRISAVTKNVTDAKNLISIVRKRFPGVSFHRFRVANRRACFQIESETSMRNMTRVLRWLHRNCVHRTDETFVLSKEDETEEDDGDNRVEIREWDVSCPTLLDVFYNTTTTATTATPSLSHRADGTEEASSPLGEATVCGQNADEVVVRLKRSRTRTCTSTGEVVEIDLDDDEISFENIPVAATGEEVGSEAAAQNARPRCTSFFQRFLVFLKKEWWVIRRQKVAFVMQLLVSALCVGLLVVIRAVVRSNYRHLPLSGPSFADDIEIWIPSIILPLNYAQAVLRQPDHSCFSRIITTTEIGDKVLDKFLGTLDTAHCVPRYILPHGVSDSESQLEAIPYVIDGVYVVDAIEIPVIDKVDTHTKIFDIFTRGEAGLLKSLAGDDSPERMSALKMNMPDGFFDLHEIDEQNISCTFGVQSFSVAELHRQSPFDAVVPALGTKFDVFGKLRLQQMIFEAYAQYANVRPETLSADELGEMLPPKYRKVVNEMLSQRFAATMPEKMQMNAIGMFDILGSFVYPVALTLPFASMLYAIVSERETGLYRLQMLWMPASSYIVYKIAFFMGTYLVSCIVLYMCGLFANLEIWTVSSPAVNFFILIPWGVTISLAAILIGRCLYSSSSAVVFSFLTCVCGSALVISTIVFLYGLPLFVGTALNTDRAMPWYLFLYPQVALVRAIYLVNYACILQRRCPTFSEVVHPTRTLTVELHNCLIALVLTPVVLALILYVIYMYDTKSLPNWMRQLRRQMCRGFPIRWGAAAAATAYESVEGMNEEGDTENYGKYEAHDDERVGHGRTKSRRSSTVGTETDLLPREHDRADCALEGLRCENTCPREVPILIRNLRKKYHGRNCDAVRDLSLCLRKGERVALLGSNGAGKSSTIKCLIGEEPITSGYAWIDGVSCCDNVDANDDSERRRVPPKVGYCSQDTCVWPMLSAREHFLFCLEICGVSNAGVRTETLLREMGLASVSGCPASNLSGGMRRRIAIGLALCVPSSCVILDEPSTGLDPATRRLVWTALQNARLGGKRRALLFTTHDMEEAEILSSRIAIMRDGALQCIGTSTDLKHRFAQGYALHISFEPHEARGAVLSAISALFPSASTIEGVTREERTLSVYISTKSTTVAEIFEKASGLAHGPRKGFTVSDWNIGQASLESVFCDICGDGISGGRGHSTE